MPTRDDAGTDATSGYTATAGLGLFAAAAHDIRQPLQAVHLLLDAARNEMDTTARNRLLDRMELAARTTDELLTSLIDLSRLEAGTIQPDVEPFRAQRLLDGIAASHRGRAEVKGLSLRTVPSRLVLDSDPIWAERIIAIFVANAIRFTDRGRILVGLRRHGDSCQIEVWDTGIGIPDDKIATTFEAFRRLPTTAAESGLGLGLAIADRLAELLGHEIVVRSVASRGSLFALRLPCVDRGTPDQHVAQLRRARAGQLDGRTIMVVEDDGAVLDATTTLLEHWGAVVVPASSSMEALAAAAALTTPLDVVVADRRLPGASGLETIHRLRRAAGRAIPALIITGDPVDHDEQDPDILVLQKPIDPARLRTALETAVRADP